MSTQEKATIEGEAMSPSSPTSTRERLVQKFDSLQEQIGRAKKAAGTFGTVKATLADFLSPIGPLTLIGTILFGIGTGVAGYMWFGKERKQLNEDLNAGKISVESFNEEVASNKWVTAFSYCLIVTALLLFFSVGGAFGSGKRGLIANNVTALQKIQNDILGLKRDVAALKKAGGLILSPSSAGDYYHNATLYTKRGKRAEAKAAYQKAISYNTNFIDPHIGYQTLLKDMEGISGARKVYRRLKAKYSSNITVQYAASLLLEDKAKVTALKAIVAKQPTYLPALYSLSQHFSTTNLGANQTMQEKQQEAKYLQMFQKANTGGKIADFYLDKDQAKVTAKNVQARNKMYTGSGIYKQMLKDPIKLTGKAIGGGNGYTLTFTIMGEVPQEIFYKLSEEGTFKSTGFMPNKNPMTGQPYPKYYIITRRLKTGSNTIWVKYRNGKGVDVGPFQKTITIRSQKVDQADSFVRYQWSLPVMKRVSVMYIRGRYFIRPMFTNNKSTFAWVKYSWNNESLDRTLLNNGRGKQQIVGRFRTGTRTLYIQFQTVHGWKSPVIKYELKMRRVRGLKWFHPVNLD